MNVIPLHSLYENLENEYFLPPIPSTKINVVFDARVKTTSGGSLNDVMLNCFEVQPNLYDILLRFTTHMFWLWISRK